MSDYERWKAQKDAIVKAEHDKIYKQGSDDGSTIAAKLIDDLISAWYGPQPFAWPEMLPQRLVERVKEFQRYYSPDTDRWRDDEEQG